MKPSDFKNMTKEELMSKQVSLKEQLMNLRAQAKLGKLDKPSNISHTRKDIARILTILREADYAKGSTEKKA
jgi:large subunit ribosomal protein L29